MITILGKSEATIAEILDNLESACDFQTITIINNLHIKDSVPYRNKLFSVIESSEPVFGYGGVLLGVYNPKVKSDIVNLFKVDSGHFCNAIHRSAQISSVAELGKGLVVCSNVSIAAYARLGNYININRNVSIGLYAVIEDFVTINPSATVGDRVKIGSGSYIGAGAILIDGITIGKDVVIQAGSVVVSDIPDGCVVNGNETVGNVSKLAV